MYQLLKNRKKNRRVCANCKRSILDVNHRRMNVCLQCGVTYCTECACEIMVSTSERVVCLSCLEKNAKEHVVEMYITNKGW